MYPVKGLGIIADGVVGNNFFTGIRGLGEVRKISANYYWYTNMLVCVASIAPAGLAMLPVSVDAALSVFCAW